MRSPIKILLVATPKELIEETSSLISNMDRTCLPYDSPYDFKGSYCWIAYENERPVAYVALKPYYGVNKHLAFLARAGVLPAARGRHLQRRLINVALKLAKKIGVTRVISFTGCHNFDSTINFLKVGFRYYIPYSYWGGGSANSLYFYKDLE